MKGEKLNMENKTILGTEYYRPPNPKVEYFSEDMKRIKKAGFTIIRTWYHWQQVNPREGEWDFKNYDKLFKEAEKNNIKVLLQVNIEVPPEWIVKKYPEGRWIDSKGRPYIPHSVGMAQLGTYPGLTPDYPPVKRHMEDFLVHTVEHYRGNPALYGYDVWNEIMPFYGVDSVHRYLYHPETKRKFQKWLEKKYKNISCLNHLYGGRNYESFKDVPIPPENGITIELLDFYEFSGDWILDHMKWKVDTVKRYDTKHPVIAHPGSGPGTVIDQTYDPCRMTDILDKWGASCYETNFWRAAFLSNLIRGASQGKGWGFVEMCGSRTWWGPYGSVLRTPEFLEQLALLPLSYGGRFNMFWQWRHERFGQESPNFGLVNEDGSFNKRTEKVSSLARAILDNQNFFDKLEFPEGDIGLLIDLRSSLMEWICKLEEKDKLVLFEYLGWFYSFSSIGANVEILYGSRIAQKGVPDNIKLLVAPLLNIEREGMTEVLKKFASRGGHILAGPYLFTFDKFTYMNEETPPEPMQKIFGSRRTDILFPTQKNIPLELHDVPSLKLTGHHCLEVYSCGEAVPWIFSGREIAGTLHSVKGARYYRLGSLAGTPVGRSVNFPEDAEYKNISTGLKSLCFDLAGSAGCSIQRVRTTGSVLLRVGRSGKEQVVFVHNPEEYSQDIWLSTEFKFKKAVDVIGNEELKTDGSRIPLRMKKRETRLLKFTL